jgi:hypothetical protein
VGTSSAIKMPKLDIKNPRTPDGLRGDSKIKGDLE